VVDADEAAVRDETCGDDAVGALDHDRASDLVGDGVGGIEAKEGSLGTL